MKRIRRMSLVLVCILILMQVTVLTSCTPNSNNNNNNEGETTVKELNSRQVSICEDLGLPTSYDELSAEQKKKITRIEELLSYLDKKYTDAFSYVGYYEGFLEKERIEAYSSQFNEYEYATLTVQEDGSFIDDYPFQFVKRLVREDIISYLSDKTGFEYKAYIVNGDTKLTDVSSVNIFAISGNTWVSFTVFVSEEKTEQDAKIIGNAISDWYKTNGIYGSTNVVAVGDDAFASINYENYESVKREQDVENLVTCDVSASGDVKIN